MLLGKEISKSWGKYCAKLAGVPDEICERAEQIEDCITKGLPILPLNSTTPEDIAKILLKIDLNNSNLHQILDAIPSP